MLVIRTRGLGGLGIGVVAGMTFVWAVVAGLAGQVWSRPILFWYWLGSIVVLLALGALFELSFRRYRVTLSNGRLSWRIRQAPGGDRPVSEVRAVERTESGSARISFGDGKSLLVAAFWFRRDDIDTLIAALERVRPGAV